MDGWGITSELTYRWLEEKMAGTSTTCIESDVFLITIIEGKLCGAMVAFWRVVNDLFYWDVSSPSYNIWMFRRTFHKFV